MACALVGDPELLFLDEPTTGLDPQSRRQLWDIIRDFGRKGRTVLLTTHYMDEAERLCDRVAIVNAGQVIALGTPRELIAGLGGEHMIEFSLVADGVPRVEADAFTDLPAVRSARREAELFSLSVERAARRAAGSAGTAEERGLALANLTTRHASLEDVFVHLAGRHIQRGRRR